MSKLTEYSHGAGCGCKLSPADLEKIIRTKTVAIPDPSLLVGNDENDDAAVYELNDGTLILSTADFFTPVVNDARTFGRIAACNAISDIYAMGGTPLFALAIMGWPIGKLPAEMAAEVMEGAGEACREAGIRIAGGHTIDSIEPFFGLSVQGTVLKDSLKRNHTARSGDILFLTKPLGSGLLTSLMKGNILREDLLDEAPHWMSMLNSAGQKFGTLEYVHALTDITGFGIAGHLGEMCRGSQLNAVLYMDKLPLMKGVKDYMFPFLMPEGAKRNREFTEEFTRVQNENQWIILADPQTNGPLMAAVHPDFRTNFEKFCAEEMIPCFEIGRMENTGLSGTIRVEDYSS